ncbi:MAG: hypothetical protein ACREKL_02685, partial [Chthoniobacterales bacterium]
PTVNPPLFAQVNKNMFRNLLKLSKAKVFAIGLVAFLFLAGIAIIVLTQFPLHGREAKQASASSAKEAAAAGSGSAAAARTMSLDEWKSRIAKAAIGDFPALMREIMGISDASLRAKVATALVARWVSEDLSGFIAFVDATEVDDDGTSDSLWAMLAPALANALPTLSDEVASRPELNEIVRRLIEYAARKNPDQALAWAKQWLLDDALESALATIAGEMIKKSPEQARQVLQEIHTPVRRVDAISAIAAVYGVTHPEEATTWARTLENSAERPYAMNAVLSARAEVQPDGAAIDLTDFRDKMAAAYSVERAAEMTRMGVSDIPPKQNGEPLTPEEAMDSETLPPREDPQAMLLDDASKAIAESWAAKDPAKAIEWANALPVGRVKEEAIQSALAGWASENPQAAYDYYMKNQATVAEPAEPIFQAWAAKEPAHAAEVANRILDPAIREKAVSGVVSGWLDSSADRAQLDAWVDKLPYPRERDLANSQISEASSFDEPDVAWQRATVIQNQGTRREALKSAFASLLDTDPAQARAMLLQAKNLTSDETARLNKMLNAVTQKASN